MPRRKPLGWPRYMVSRRIKSSIAYYWDIPTWAKKKGCLLTIEALGTDYSVAKKRCDELLNPQFDAWRKDEPVNLITSNDVTKRGSFDWMVAIFKSSPQYGNYLQKLESSMMRR